MPPSFLKTIPVFPGYLCKNDGLFLYGAIAPMPFVYCYEQHATEVVYGPSCIIEKEINVDKCEVDGIPLIPRRGGGGTVVLAPGMVITVVVGERMKEKEGKARKGNAEENEIEELSIANSQSSIVNEGQGQRKSSERYEAIADASEKKENRGSEIIRIFDRIHQAFINILSPYMQRQIEQKGISDLAINNKKILGSSLYIGQSPALYYYQSSLIVHADINLISRYLKQPPKEPDYRAGRNHDSFCTNLKNEGCALTAGDIKNVLLEKLAGHLSIGSNQCGNQ